MTVITKTVVVDTNPIFREGLVRILSDAGSVSCAGFRSVGEIAEVAVADGKRTLFLIDLGQDRGVVAHGIGSLKQRFPESIVVVLSERYSHGHMIGAFKAGASGYLMKHTSCEALIKSLELVSLGEQVFPPQALQLLTSAEILEAPAKPTILQASNPLSTREVEVLCALSQGKSNKIIARQWGISEATVKVHVKAILRKTQARNRTEAALWARDHGLGVNTNGNPIRMATTN